MKYTILFDTETTGLLKPDITPLSEQPYIIEFSAVKIDENFNLIESMDFLAKPPIVLPPEITKITGIKPEQLEDAEPFGDAFEELVDFFLGVHRLVGHNLPFDKGMLANELRRIEMLTQFPWPPSNVCTVEASMPIQQRRLPLVKLHTMATGAPHEGAHRAKEDVFATVRCYHWLMEKGLVEPL